MFRKMILIVVLQRKPHYLSAFMRLAKIIANALMRYFRKDNSVVFAVVLVMISLITSFSACSGENRDTTQTGAVSQGEGSKDSVSESGNQGNPGQKVITLSLRRSERYLESAAAKLQENYPDYRVEIKEPNLQSTGDVISYQQALQTEIMTGNGPDMIETVGTPYEKFISKDLLYDMSDRMSKDKDFDINQYYSNLFEALKLDGHTYTIPICFVFNVITANQGILEEEKINIDSSKWTWQDFASIAEKVTKTDSQGIAVRTALPNVSLSDLLDYFLSYGNFDRFADKEKKSASFDSQEFIGILELVKSFADKNLVADGQKMSASEVIDAASRGAVVFKPDAIPGYFNYAIAKSMFNGKVSLLEFPTEAGTGSGVFNPQLAFGISSSSKYKDMAWEYIKIMLSEEIQLQTEYGFPVNKAAQHKMAQQAMDKSFGGSVQWGGKAIEYQPLTQEDIDVIDRLISSSNQYSLFDVQIYRIIKDETDAFFSGDKSAAEVAGLIQNRVNTYLNE